MNDELKELTLERLLELVHAYGEHAFDLLKLLRSEQARNKELNTENSDWLDVYQKLQSENAALRAEKSRLESRIRELQGES